MTNKQERYSNAFFKILHTLLSYRLRGQSDDFAKKAVESLIRKLMNKVDELDELLSAITSKGSNTTKCVKIYRNLDGRVQIDEKKVFPHVLYVQIWRWPDVRRHDLVNIDSCNYDVTLSQELTCVNPYHYKRRESPLSDLLNTYSLIKAQEESIDSPPITTNYDSSTEPVESDVEPVMRNRDSTNFLKLQTSGSTQDHFSEHSTSSSRKNRSSNLPKSCTPSSETLSHEAAPNIVFDPESAIFAIESIKRLSIKDTPDPNPLPSEPRSENWCSITYYEFDVQVEDVFKVSVNYPTVTIDGYVSPSCKDRFCLGALSNVKRAVGCDRTRMHIGRGVQLSMNTEGDVWLTCLSEQSIFVHSFMNQMTESRPEDSVLKVLSMQSIKVFDLNQCHLQMMTKVEQSKARRNMLTTLGPGDMSNELDVGADDLRQMCCLRLSFVKGWGGNYNRRNIEETPCWIEVQFHKGFQLCDDLLRSIHFTFANTKYEHQ